MNILFITFSFPPRNEIALVRIWNIVKGLSKNGNIVSVLTVDRKLVKNQENIQKWKSEIKQYEIELLEVPFPLHSVEKTYFNTNHEGIKGAINNILGKGGRFVASLFSEESKRFWLYSVKKFFNKKQNFPYDLIIASGGPFVDFEIAHYLSNKYKVPYVLDYRDLWNLNPTKPERPLKIQKREQRILSSAIGVVSVTDGMNDIILNKFSNLSKHKFFVVTNGFERSRLETVPLERYSETSIVYTGSFYFPIRNIEPIFRALSLVKNIDKLEWKFHYYGKHSTHIKDIGEKFDLSSRIVDHGMVSKDEALEATKSADLFVVISSVSPETTNENKIMVTGKIFDALGAGTPILLIAPPGSDPEKIMGNRGVRFSGDQIEEMAEYLRSVIKNGIERNTPAYEYEWSRLADRYNDIVQNLVSEYKRENNH